MRDVCPSIDSIGAQVSHLESLRKNFRMEFPIMKTRIPNVPSSNCSGLPDPKPETLINRGDLFCFCVHLLNWSVVGAADRVESSEISLSCGLPVQTSIPKPQNRTRNYGFNPKAQNSGGGGL